MGDSVTLINDPTWRTTNLGAVPPLAFFSRGLPFFLRCDFVSPIDVRHFRDGSWSWFCWSSPRVRVFSVLLSSSLYLIIPIKSIRRAAHFKTSQSLDQNRNWGTADYPLCFTIHVRWLTPTAPNTPQDLKIQADNNHHFAAISRSLFKFSKLLSRSYYEIPPSMLSLSSVSWPSFWDPTRYPP